RRSASWPPPSWPPWSCATPGPQPPRPGPRPPNPSLSPDPRHRKSRRPVTGAPASLLLAEPEDPAGAAVAGLHHQAGVVVAAEVAGGDAVAVGEVDWPREDLEVRP